MEFCDLRNEISKIYPDFDDEKLNSIIQKFQVYADFLISENKKYNLTSITEIKDIISKHFYDSISVLKIKKFSKEKIMDLGTGGGFPGIPLKILCEDIDLYLCEPTKKKCLFLEKIIELLNLKKVTILNKRAEELEKKYFNYFDFIVTRAVSQLNILLELSIPYLKIKGQLIAYKSLKYEEEIANSKHALKELSSNIIGIENVVFENNTRNLVFIQKNKSTKHIYPRNYSEISKKPL